MNSSDTLIQYFASKQKQLIAASDQVVSSHNTLKGTYRESLIDIYLRDFLPKRYSIGKGMLVGSDQAGGEFKTDSIYPPSSLPFIILSEKIEQLCRAHD